MAKLKRGLLGGFSGKIANVVGTSWKGIEAMRSLPLSVANPNTSGQQAQRGAFSQTVIVAQMLLSQYIKPLWDSFVSQQSGFNGFIQANISAFTTAGLDSPADMLLSRGSYTGLDNLSSATPAGETGPNVTWDDDSGNSDDEVFVVAYNETQDEWAHGPDGLKVRSDEIANPKFENTTQAGDVLHVWASVRRNDGRSVSTSQYVTETVS